MMFNIHFDFFFDAKSIQGKEKVLRKTYQLLIDRFGLKSVNHIGESKFIVIFESHDWESLIFNLIEFSQTIGQQWIITGSISFEFSLWSNNPKIVGVSSIGINTDNILITES